MMEDIGLFKQGWKWLQSKQHCYSVARTAATCFRDKIGIFIERHWPVVCCACARLGRVLHYLLIHWKDCVGRGFRSFVGLGSAALLVIMWSCFLSLTSMSCLIYVLLSMGVAGGAVQYLGYTPGLFIVGLCAILVLWMYANFWITGTLFIVGGYLFSLNHARFVVLMATIYSLYCVKVRVGWLGVIVSLNLSFLSNDLLSYVLQWCDNLRETTHFEEHKESESFDEAEMPNSCKFSLQPLRENPLFGPSSSTLEKLGALEWTKVVHKDQGWRLVTCIWLHAGIIHLATNMLSLVFIGIRLEQQFGFVRIGIIYLLSGFGGSILSALFIQRNISVGASGALFGLLGAMLSELITNWTIYTNKAAAIITLLFIVIVNLAVGILPHVNNYAHIGGFLAGLLLGFVFLPRPQFGWVQSHDLPAGVRLKSKYKAYQYVLWLVSLILLVAGLSVGVVMVFGGANGNENCHWCHYLSCVPTSNWKCDDDDGT